MIKLLDGNIFDSDVEALVNPVNCIGVSGAGLALEFKKRFPGYSYNYAALCSLGNVRMGNVYIYFVAYKDYKSLKYIVSFPTKTHYSRSSKPEYVESGLDSLAEKIQEYDIRSIAIPALGCGLGGLDFNLVFSLMMKKLSLVSKDREVFIYSPLKERKVFLK